jgi:hypothetical protein
LHTGFDAIRPRPIAKTLAEAAFEGDVIDHLRYQPQTARDGHRFHDNRIEFNEKRGIFVSLARVRQASRRSQRGLKTRASPLSSGVIA